MGSTRSNWRNCRISFQQLTQKPVAPLYRIHQQAISTGVEDLANRHDH